MWYNISMEQDNNRNPDGTFKKGHSGNYGGRPRNTLKAFLAREFREMSDDEKRQWLLDNKIPPEVMWKMAEGNPDSAQKIEHNFEGVEDEAELLKDI